MANHRSFGRDRRVDGLGSVHGVTIPHHEQLQRIHNAFSSVNSAALIATVPVAIYSIGWLRKDSYAQDRALLAGEAVADGFILDIPFKGITGRKQPLNYLGNGPIPTAFSMGRTIRLILVGSTRCTPWRLLPLPLLSPDDIGITAGFPSWRTDWPEQLTFLESHGATTSQLTCFLARPWAM